MFCPRCQKQFASARAYCFECGQRLTRSVSMSSFKSSVTTRVGAIFEGRYKLIGLLGKGATSRVYLADDLVAKCPVAVKAFTPSGVGGKERFLREARAVMAIQHPNVVKVMHVGEQANGTPYSVLEILRGESFGDYLRREHKMPPNLALDLVRQAAAGLSAAHDAGVVHRDVKPDNLFLLGEPGEPYGLKVIDFGLAKLARGKGSSASGIIVGTLAYMAPEQILCEAVDARTDVYALGVVAFRALTGELPFAAEDDTDLVVQQLFEKPRSVIALAPELDRRVERIIQTAMRKRPDNRYATMDAMRADLARLVGLEPGDAMGAPLAFEPDRYVPTTPTGRAANATLEKRTLH